MTASTPSTRFMADFAAFVHPLSERDFFESWYGKRPRHSSGSNALSPVLSLQDMIARVECLQLEFTTDYSLARDGEKLAPMFHASLTKNANWLPRLLNENWTLILNALQRDFLPLSHVAAELGRKLKSHVNINAYYTPPGGKGFDFHTDKHDVFIWQQSGKKAWKVMAEGDEDESRPAIDHVLEAGEVLYIPENCRHAAVACSDADSLHLTFGFSSRYAQAKKHLQDQLQDWINTGMSTGLNDLALPCQLADEQSRISQEEVLYAMTAFQRQLIGPPDRHTDSIPDNSPLNRNMMPDEVVETLLELNIDSTCSLAESGQLKPGDDGGIQLHLASGDLVFAKEFREALTMVCRPGPFPIRDLPLEPEAAVNLCRVLMSVGVMRTES